MKRKTAFPNIANSNPSMCISSAMNKCNRIVANIFRKHLKPFGITNSQLTMLFIITKAESVNQKRIADMLFMEKSTVNRNLQRLLDKKWITYDSDKTLLTTKQGKLLLEEVIPFWDTAMEEVKEVLGKKGEDSLFYMTKKLTR